MRFEKVSLEQYKKDFVGDTVGMRYNHFNVSEDIVNHRFYGYESAYQSNVEDIYNDIKLPKRGTKKSAGYDFFAPYDFYLSAGDTIKIATGIRVILDDDKFLMCAPRSGHGFKARIQLDNTIGVIDADYSESSNEGHIMVKLTNDSREGKSIQVKKGDGMLQAIIMQYFKVDDDDADAQRDGGFGSTTKEVK